MKITNEQLEEVIRVLNIIADEDNWETETEYGPYGSYFKKVWTDSYNIQELAEIILEEIEDGNKN